MPVLLCIEFPTEQRHLTHALIPFSMARCLLCIIIKSIYIYEYNIHVSYTVRVCTLEMWRLLIFLIIFIMKLKTLVHFLIVFLSLLFSYQILYLMELYVRIVKFDNKLWGEKDLESKIFKISR